jgi:alkyl sulfatase BDS1-like metallo-beta-lactamase superfamily hydrolase
LLWEIDPGKLTPEILDKLAERLMNKALGGNQRAVAEARRQIEAGETPTVESVAEVIEQQEPKE